MLTLILAHLKGSLFSCISVLIQFLLMFTLSCCHRLVLFGIMYRVQKKEHGGKLGVITCILDFAYIRLGSCIKYSLRLCVLQTISGSLSSFFISWHLGKKVKTFVSFLFLVFFVIAVACVSSLHVSQYTN